MEANIQVLPEIWKPIKGFEGRYEISSNGRVKSLPGINHHYHRPEKIKKASISKKGYYYVALWIKDKHKHFLVHRLLAIHFIPNPENKPQVNHKDGIKLNISLSNLEWATHKENGVHAYLMGLTPKPPGHKKKGEQIYNAVLNEEKVLKIRELFNSGMHTQKELGKMYSVTRSCVQSITRRWSWKHI